MARRPGFTARALVQVEQAAGRYIPQVSVETRVHYPPAATQEQVEQAIRTAADSALHMAHLNLSGRVPGSTAPAAAPTRFATVFVSRQRSGEPAGYGWQVLDVGQTLAVGRWNGDPGWPSSVEQMDSDPGWQGALTSHLRDCGVDVVTEWVLEDGVLWAGCAVDDRRPAAAPSSRGGT